MPAGMGPGSKQTTERAKDFKGTIFTLLRYMRGHSIAVAFALICAIASTAFNVIGPDILGKITTKIFEGLMGRVQGAQASTSKASARLWPSLSAFTWPLVSSLSSKAF